MENWNVGRYRVVRRAMSEEEICNNESVLSKRCWQIRKTSHREIQVNTLNCPRDRDAPWGCSHTGAIGKTASIHVFMAMTAPYTLPR